MEDTNQHHTATNKQKLLLKLKKQNSEGKLIWKLKGIGAHEGDEWTPDSNRERAKAIFETERASTENETWMNVRLQPDGQQLFGNLKEEKDEGHKWTPDRNCEREKTIFENWKA